MGQKAKIIIRQKARLFVYQAVGGLSIPQDLRIQQREGACRDFAA